MTKTMSDDVWPDAASDAIISTETDENGSVGVVMPDASNNAPQNESEAPETNSDVFPRHYVEELRKESGGYRERAKTAEANADALSKRLHTALVAATGRLADPADVPYDAEHLDEPEKLAAAIDALLEAKPHLKARKVSGDVGLGQRDSGTPTVDLLGMLRART